MKPPKFKMTELGPIPEDWEVKRLGEIAAIARGGSPRPIEAYLSTDVTAINWIKIGDVGPDAKYITETQERIIRDGVSKSRMVYPGDFLLSNSMSFGRPYITKIAGCIHDGWLVIQNYQEYYDTEFLYYILGSDTVFCQYMTMAAGSSVQNLNKEVVSSVIAPLPPLPEQRRIAGALSDVDELISALGKLIEKKRNIKTGTMQQLITGKRRLPGFGGAEFKQTELGPIPSDWEVKRLGEVCEILDNRRVPLNDSQRKKGLYPYCGANGIVDYIDRYAFNETVILIAEDGGNFSDFATRPIAYQMSGKFWVNNHAHVLVTKENAFQSFVFCQLEHKDITDVISGGTRAKLTRGQLEGLLIVLPPTLPEQRAIAAVLSDMDAEIAALEAEKHKVESIKQGMMQELLTGRVRLMQ